MPAASQAVAAACRAKGATVDAGAIDVVDRAALAAWLTRSTMPIRSTCVIANAGISIDKDNSSLDDFSVVRKTLDVNVGGVLNTVEPLVGRMMARRRGQIAVVSSLAGFIGLPYSASYNASKAAVRVWGESIRYVLKKSGVGVSVDLPGLRRQPHDRQRALPDAVPDDRRRGPRRSSAAASRATRRASPSRSAPRRRSGSAGSCPAAGPRGCSAPRPRRVDPWLIMSCREQGRGTAAARSLLPPYFSKRRRGRRRHRPRPHPAAA